MIYEDHPVLRLWYHQLSLETDEEVTKLTREDDTVEMHIEGELVTTTQIEWLQSRMISAPLAVGGCEDSTWACVAFYDGTVDIWSVAFNMKVHTLRHGKPV